jgi:hypothetical protein
MCTLWEQKLQKGNERPNLVYVYDVNEGEWIVHSPSVHFANKEVRQGNVVTTVQRKWLRKSVVRFVLFVLLLSPLAILFSFILTFTFYHVVVKWHCWNFTTTTQRKKMFMKLIRFMYYNQRRTLSQKKFAKCLVSRYWKWRKNSIRCCRHSGLNIKTRDEKNTERVEKKPISQHGLLSKECCLMVRFKPRITENT